jgi:hypothetical protein
VRTVNCNRGFPGKNVLLRCDHTVEVVESRRCNSAAMAVLLQHTYNRDAFMKQLWKRQQRQSDVEMCPAHHQH